MKWVNILKGEKQENSFMVKAELEAMREKHAAILIEVQKAKEGCMVAQRADLAEGTKETRAAVKKYKDAVAELEMKLETIENILPELEEVHDKAEKEDAQKRLVEINTELAALNKVHAEMMDNFLDALAKAQALYHLSHNQYPPSLTEAGNIFGYGNEKAIRLKKKTDEYIGGALPVNAHRLNILREESKLKERLAL